MTGNTVALGSDPSTGQLAMALLRGFAIPMFVLGLLTSRLVVEAARRRRVRRAATWLFGAEALVLLLLVLLGQSAMQGGEARLASTSRLYLLVALPSVAMGLQNATSTHFGPLQVRTTHVTGTLSKFADSAASYLVALHDRLRTPAGQGPGGASGASSERRSLREAGLLLLAWVFYLGGCVIAGLLKLVWELRALALPIACLLILACVDLYNPLLPEEADEGSQEGP
jgi:uncharacterized membrane protein YoaK (UPF0700 family)